jgi:hypothetical protein
MPTVTAPSKEAVRLYLQERANAPTPPGTPAEIRRQLGWWLLPHNNLPPGSR